MCGPSSPTNTTSNIVTEQKLPDWYVGYLQNIMGRAVTQADSNQGPPPIQQIAPLTADQQNAYQDIRAIQGSATPYYNQAGSDINAAQGVDFSGAAGAGNGNIGQGVGMLGSAGSRDTASVAQPYVGQGASYLTGAAQGSSLGAANPYIAASTQPTGLQAASPFIGAASQSSASGINQYLNPYNTAVTDRIAQLGARNLNENLLPGISDAFIRAGQYGSQQMGTLGERAVRDTNESVMGQQAQALQQGYSQALGASQSDQARMAQLASTAGGLGTAQQQALLGAGSTLGGLSSSDLQRQLTAGQGLGQFGLGLSSAQAADASRQLAAGQSIGQLGLGQGQLGLSAAQDQASTLLQAGQAQRDLGTTGQDQSAKMAALLEQVGAAQQGQGQASLNSLFNNQTAQYNLPWDTIAKLSGVIQGLPVSPSQSQNAVTSQPGPSPTSQLAGIGLGVAGLANSGLFKAKGGAVRKVPYKRTHSYGNVPKRGLSVFEQAA